VGTESDELAIPQKRPTSEAASIVADKLQRSKPLDKARDHALAYQSYH
jgi:hypothetical protein